MKPSGHETRRAFSAVQGGARRNRRARVRLGFSNGWLIVGEAGAVLVDAGFARREGSLARALSRLGLRPRDLRLVVVTHAHFDHVGSLAAIKRHTGAEVAVHEAEAECLLSGRPLMPRGLSPRARLAVAYGARHPERTRVAPVRPDVIIRGGLDLRPWGLAGRVVGTPGHSPGSVSVLLDEGSAFIGDVAANSFRPVLGVRPSVFGEDREDLARSWERLLASGARTACPGHGPPFAIARLAGLLAAARRR